MIICSCYCSYITGEKIPDFLWDDKSTSRVTITKQQCLSKLNNTLIFHLKRFELNFDTFLREKVNEHFTFPLTLDMYPYSRDAALDKLKEKLTDGL